MPDSYDLFGILTQDAVVPPDLEFKPKSDVTHPDPMQMLEHVLQVTNELVHAWTQDGIQSFEDDARVVELHSKMLAATNPLERLSLSIDVKNEKAKVSAERLQFDKVAGDLHDLGKGAASVAFLTGDYQLSKQIAVVTEQSFHVGMQIAGLAGFGSLAATGAVNPVGLGVSLLGAAAAISDAFSPQKDPIRPMLTAILTQLANQHREIMAEMALRHIDIKAQIGELGLEVVTGFATLSERVECIQETLGLLHCMVVENSIQTKHTLNSFSQSMAAILDIVKHKTTIDVVDIISKPINRIVYNGSGGYLDEKTIRSLVSKLITSVKVTSKRAEVAGSNDVPKNLNLSQWNISSRTAGFADFHINELRAIAARHMPGIPDTSLSNPLLWCYSTLALLILYRKQYSVDPKHRNHISTREIKNIQGLVQDGQQIQELQQRLRAPELYESLLTELQASLQQFKACYQQHLMEFRVKQEKEIEILRRKEDAEISEVQVNALKYQRIDVNGLYHRWFDGESNFRGNGTKSYMSLRPGARGGDSEYNHHAYIALETFVTTGKAQILEQKTAYLGSYGFAIYPEGSFSGPVLPITRELAIKIQESLPMAMTGAVKLNLASFYFRYSVDDDHRFHLKTYVNDQLCHHITMQYEPLFYEGAEAIWWYWVGGRVPIDASYNPVFAFTGVGSTGTHYYDYSIYHPIPKPRLGALTTLSSRETLLVNKVSDDVGLLVMHSSEQLIQKKQEQIRKSYNREVMNTFKSDTDSAFGQAITEFFAKLTCLKTFLALCLHDEYENPDSDLNRLLHALDIPTSREETVAYLQANDSEVGLDMLDKAEILLTLYQMHLPAILATPRESFYAMVETVTDECCRFVEAYAPTQVEENSVYPFGEHDNEASKDEKIVATRAKNAMLEGMLMSMMEGIYALNLPPEQTEIFWQAAFANFKKKFPEVDVALTPGSMLASSRGNPVFGASRALMGGADNATGAEEATEGQEMFLL